MGAPHVAYGLWLLPLFSGHLNLMATCNGLQPEGASLVRHLAETGGKLSPSVEAVGMMYSGTGHAMPGGLR
jgi:hypothetical protein